VLFLFGIAMGIFGSAVILGLGPASEWLVWPIPALLSPFAAVFYPLSSLPGWMRFIAHMLPASYVFEGLRALVATGRVSPGDLLWAVRWQWCTFCSPPATSSARSSMPCETGSWRGMRPRA